MNRRARDRKASSRSTLWSAAFCILPPRWQKPLHCPRTSPRVDFRARGLPLGQVRRWPLLPLGEQVEPRIRPVKQIEAARPQVGGCQSAAKPLEGAVVHAHVAQRALAGRSDLLPDVIVQHWPEVEWRARLAAGITDDGCACAHPGKLHCKLCAPLSAREVTTPSSARAWSSACGSTWALEAAASTVVTGLGPPASASLRKRCARSRRSGGLGGVDFSRAPLRACLRASLRASLARSRRALTAVLRLTLAILAISVGVASGLALSAASARSRASAGARRLDFRRDRK